MIQLTNSLIVSNLELRLCPNTLENSSLSKTSQVIGRLEKEFNDHDELVAINFKKINELNPFPESFDCEMNPDYIDGGHGIQVSHHS